MGSIIRKPKRSTQTRKKSRDERGSTNQPANSARFQMLKRGWNETVKPHKEMIGYELMVEMNKVEGYHTFFTSLPTTVSLQQHAENFFGSLDMIVQNLDDKSFLKAFIRDIGGFHLNKVPNFSFQTLDVVADVLLETMVKHMGATYHDTWIEVIGLMKRYLMEGLIARKLSVNNDTLQVESSSSFLR